MTEAMRAWLRLALGCLGLLCEAGAGHGSSGPAQSILLVVDDDDDDDDGVADRSASPLRGRALERLLRLPRERLDAAQRAPEKGPFRFIGPTGLPLEPGALLSPAPVALLQGMYPGSGMLQTRGEPTQVAVIELRALDSAGRRMDLARSHASLSRELPAELDAKRPDEDALRWLVIGPAEALPTSLLVLSEAPDGAPLDQLGDLPLTDAPCPDDVPSELRCRLSPPLRASTDPVDREHPAAAFRSVLAEVGGRLRVKVAPGVGVGIRVGGPREAAGYTVGRYRARIRIHVLRTAPQAPAVGEDDQDARQLLRREVAVASAIWGQCGIHFGPPEELDVRVVDVPPAHLFALGCGEGQPASGGKIGVLVGGRLVEVETRAGELPVDVAVRLSQAIEAAGFQSRVSANAAAHRSATRTADVLVRDQRGRFVALGTLQNRPASTDPSLPVCLGEVDLADGLQHFTDFNAGAGTVEERALVKAFEDDDPATIELIVVPSFGGTGRIGESFVFGHGTSLQNAIILDRAGIRSGARSFTLAHELGHILLDMPGHPDDFGVDVPSSLMDADASDDTIFGPRRLSVAECERALRQSGPGALTPLLEPWPLFVPRP